MSVLICVITLHVFSHLDYNAQTLQHCKVMLYIDQHQMGENLEASLHSRGQVFPVAVPASKLGGGQRGGKRKFFWGGQKKRQKYVRRAQKLAIFAIFMLKSSNLV